jgi:hypothetical protein
VAKPGVALADVEGFPPSAVERLRDEASVTTAEEFADLARRMGPSLQALLDADDEEFARLRALAEAVAPDVGGEPGEFRTGMDPPPGGRDTHSG